MRFWLSFNISALYAIENDQSSWISPEHVIEKEKLGRSRKHYYKSRQQKRGVMKVHVKEIASESNAINRRNKAVDREPKYPESNRQQ